MALFRSVIVAVCLLIHASSGEHCDSGSNEEECTPTQEQAGQVLLQRTRGANALRKIAAEQTDVLAEAGDSNSSIFGKGGISTLDANAASTSMGPAATFLMQATFGPTRASLQKLSDIGTEAWLTEQLSLPVESHREFYRARANPHYIEAVQDGFSERHQCSKGSRWYGYAFSGDDKGKSVEVSGGEVFVDGVKRTDIDDKVWQNRNNLPQPTSCANENPELTCTSSKLDTSKNEQCNLNAEYVAGNLCQKSCFDQGFGYAGDDCSRGWVAISVAEFSGYICEVREGVGGWMTISTKAFCAPSSLEAVLNPAIWIKDSQDFVNTQLDFDTSPAMNHPEILDILFLSSDQPSCDLDSKLFMKSGEKYYRHSSRMVLSESTLENPTQCTSATFVNRKDCRVLPPSESNECDMQCGSPGEIANDPSMGHQFPFYTRKGSDPDSFLDNRYGTKQNSRLAKSTVWVAKALTSDDQLRQRMAWALSQIIVLSAHGTDHGSWSEMFLYFYDILVRHAFGNFRDILREVTYSPLMANYLTYRGSSSFDFSGSFPDENYARELMQLFTIGVVNLNPDGTTVMDENGVEVPAYSNENIMSFAQVFTGFMQADLRYNMEMKLVPNNWIDPMQMVEPRHDVYPKSDLIGGYLGDGYPLCSDLPPRYFLSEGAQYDFLGYTYDDDDFDVVVAPATSALYGVICSGEDSSDGSCAYAATVTLQETLNCDGAECNMDDLAVVKVGAAYYEFIPPPCVYKFFYNGRKAEVANSRRRIYDPICVDAAQETASAACCETCSDFVKEKGFHVNCTEGAYLESLACDSFGDLVSYERAEAQCSALGLSVCGMAHVSQCGASFPSTRRRDRRLYLWNATECSLDVEVHEDGKVSGHTTNKENRFMVAWTGEVPAVGVYQAVVTDSVVFSAVPSKEELKAELKVGAYQPPTGSCTEACDQEVKVYGSSFDVNTVFECDGRFYKNVESLVSVGDQTLRNPPVFMRPGPVETASNIWRQRARAALNEVDSLIDHLLYHPNTPLFISKKLIQRFTTSNPTTAYLTAVAEAFKSGTYNDVTYSGKYGDLQATVVAILMHPDARGSSANDGKLREPMLKLMHFLRAMEYADAKNEPIVLEMLDDVVGQFPYLSPTVFNYFDAQFQPPRFSTLEVAASSFLEENSSEAGTYGPDDSSVHEAGLFGPEFQVFTAPSVVGWLNGMAALIDGGKGLTSCDRGFAVNDDLSCSRVRGSLTFDVEASPAPATAPTPDTPAVPAPSGSYEQFGTGQCRGTATNHNPAEWYTPLTSMVQDTYSLQQCQDICSHADGCQAIEWKLDGTRCELWHEEPLAFSASGTDKCYKNPEASLSLIYKWDTDTGLLGWEVSGGQADITYQNAGRRRNNFGLLPFEWKNKGKAHTSIVVRSPVHCDLTSVRVRLSGGKSPSVGDPLAEDFLGLVLISQQTGEATSTIEMTKNSYTMQSYQLDDLDGGCYHVELRDGASGTWGWLVLQDVIFTGLTTRPEPLGDIMGEMPMGLLQDKLAVNSSAASPDMAWNSLAGCSLEASSEFVSNTVDFAVDNLKVPDGNSMWRDNGKGVHQWIKITAEAPVTVGGLRLKIDSVKVGSCFKDYIVEYSDDGATWFVASAGQSKNLDSSKFQEFAWPARTAQYWRLWMKNTWGFLSLSIKYMEILTPELAPRVSAAVQELDLLLTGGRLTDESEQVVRAAYDAANVGDQLAAAQQAVLLTPEFNNFGDPQPDGVRPPKEVQPEGHAPADYKATIMLFLAGGADTFHMLVPLDCPLYNEYAERRAGVVHAQDEVLPITASTQDCKKFGIHPALPFVQQLYETEKTAAFVSNVGNLIQPLDRNEYQNGGRTCLGMFSHAHQQAAAQTLKCQIAGAAPRGVGGRLADELGKKGLRTTSFSIAGSTIWSQGFDTGVEMIDKNSKGGKDSGIRFSSYDRWSDVISNLTNQKYKNSYCEEYVQAFTEAIDSSETMGEVLENVQLSSNWQDPEGPLAKQLYQVARLMSTHDARKAERDIFFVSLPGFDTHRDLKVIMNDNFAEINTALESFVGEIKAQGLWENTVLATESDFGRTLVWNGEGTDHGWAGNHLILGGGINGGTIFNKFVTSYLEGADNDAGRGRIIPGYPWESMMVPIAEWLGVTNPSNIFPNLGNFNSTHIIQDMFS